MGSWRPLCFGKQYSEWRKDCKECPFCGNCKSYSDDYREHLYFKYYEDEVDERLRLRG